jgi:DNA-binding protein YbaB
MSDDILDPDGAFAELDAWQGNIDRLTAATRAMSDRMKSLRVTASDEHDMVEVTIDAGGALTGLKLSRRIQQVPPEDVADTVMRTIQAARGKAADRAQEIIAETVGPGRSLGALVDRQLRGEPRE